MCVYNNSKERHWTPCCKYSFFLLLVLYYEDTTVGQGVLQVAEGDWQLSGWMEGNGYPSFVSNSVYSI